MDVRYQEALTHYNPFKDRVILAMGKGLTAASIEHQMIMENELA
jgi:hypothetical protein